MKNHLQNHHPAARLASVLLVMLIGACAALDSTPTASVTDRIRTASSSSEHVSLAEFYDREVQSARQKAAEHRQMQEAYRGRAGVGRGGLEQQASILRHCAGLIEQYDRAALEYQELAALHRQLAKAAAR